MPTLATTLATLSLISTHLLLLVSAQSNVTIRDIDPRISFTPLCSPRSQPCPGGWYNYNFTTEETRTVSFGPAEETRFVQPSASFTFNGTAIYYYAVSSGRTASVTISLDGGTGQLVNLTQTHNLTFTSGIYFPTFAWSAENLNPNTQHTFYLEFAEPDALALGKWAGFDSLVYTPATPAVVSATAVTTIQATPTGGSTSHNKNVNAAIIGGVFGGTFVALLIVGSIIWFCVKKKERPLSARPSSGAWTIDGARSIRPTTMTGGDGGNAPRRQSTATRIHSVYQGDPMDVPGTLLSPRLAPFNSPESIPLPNSPTSPTSPRHSARYSVAPSTLLDLQNPDSLALLARQQQEILELLRIQRILPPVSEFDELGMAPMSPFSGRNSLLAPRHSFFAPSPTTTPSHPSWLPDQKTTSGSSSNASPFASMTPSASVPSTPSPPPSDGPMPSSESLGVRPLPIPTSPPAAASLQTPRPLPTSPLALPPMPPIPLEAPATGLQRSNTTSASINTYRTGPPAYSPN